MGSTVHPWSAFGEQRTARHAERRAIGERIVRAREARGLSQTEAARLVGIWQPNLSKYEHGRTPISRGMVRRIAVALDVPSRWLLKGGEAPWGD